MTATIDCTAMVDEKSVHDTFSAALNFPSSYGRNLDALYDLLSSCELTLTLTHAAALMSREQVRRLPVIEGRRLVGMVTLSDLSHREDYTMEAAETLSEITANVKNL